MGFERNRTIKLQRGLYLLEQVNAVTYATRAWIAGKWQYTNLETTDYNAAEKRALVWFRKLTPAGIGESFATAMGAYLKSIRDDGKRTNHTWRWNAWREFWSPGMGRADVAVVDVDSPKLLAFVEWRRQALPNINASTLKKDLTTVRQCLKHAALRGVIATLPQFPGAHTLGRVVTNPQPWLTPGEWSTLIKAAEQRVKAAPNTRTRGQREELLVFLRFMHATCLRVDEARNIRARDCMKKYTQAAKPQELERRERKAMKTAKPGDLVVLDVQAPYLEITVRKSKTGSRTTVSRAFIHPTIVKWIEAKKPADLLFSEHHRDAFRELLIAAGLRNTPYGTRNAKCLRPTAISHWLINRPTIPLSWLAANCGTSITMLQDFYVKRLGLGLDGTAWL